MLSIVERFESVDRRTAIPLLVGAVIFVLSTNAFALNTLLLNHGSMISAVGPNPVSYNQGTDPSGKFGGCLYPHYVYNVSMGALGFPSSAYNASRGTIEFWYKPNSTNGTVIFATGNGDPGNGASTDALNLYQNWFWGCNYPLASVSSPTNLWDYITRPASQSWTWDTNRWYHIAVTYKAENKSDDFVHLYIDGVKQTDFAGGAEYRNITTQPTGNIWFGGWSETAWWAGPARFDDIRICDDIIYTGNFTPPASQITEISDGPNTLLLNNGRVVSTIGTTPVAYNQGTDPGGKFGGCLYPHYVYNVSLGALGFLPSAYNPSRGTIEFWYKPNSTNGTVIFATGNGDPGNGSSSDALNLYQNWFWGQNYPLASISSPTNLWDYITRPASQSWTWDTNHWYHIAVTYKATNEPDDFVHLYIDGVKQTDFAGLAEYRNITTQPTGNIWFGGWSENAWWPGPARFDDIRICDDIIYTANFAPQTTELGPARRQPRTLLLNHGSLSSTVGPDPVAYNQGIDTSGKFEGCLYPHYVYNVSWGALGFPSSAYNASRGTIEFWYRPDSTNGTVIFATGGDPGNGSGTNALNLYQNWFWGQNYPLASASSPTNLWDYITRPASQSWTWDTNRWYHIAVTYKAENQSDDFVHLYIDGVKQTDFAGGAEYRNITTQPSGNIWFGGWSETAWWSGPARFDDIRICDDIIYTDNFIPPTAELRSVPERNTYFGKRWVRNHPFQLFGWSLTAADYVNSDAGAALYKGLGFSTAQLPVQDVSLSGAQAMVASATQRGLNWQGRLWSDGADAEMITLINTIIGRDADVAWQLTDEPTQTLLPGVGASAEWIRQNRPNCMNMLNVGLNQFSFLDDCMDVIEPDVLMIDIYPFYITYNEPTFFQHLMTLRSTAQQYGVPYWMWLQSLGNDDYRLPSESDYRMQTFTALTMGYTGLGCWTYDTNYGINGLVTSSGTKSALYDAAAATHSEAANLGARLRFLESTDVRFIPNESNPTPAGLTNWSSGAGGISQITNVVVDSGQSGSAKNGLIGFFIDDDGRYWFMVTNLYSGASLNATQATLNLTVTFATGTTCVYRVDRTTGSQVQVNLDGNRQLHLTLPGGSGDLFCMEPF
ncbi:MAG: LamG-like jellyroll fold domain-containing protein [Armatimonadota bacterium]